MSRSPGQYFALGLERLPDLSSLLFTQVLCVNMQKMYATKMPWSVIKLLMQKVNYREVECTCNMKSLLKKFSELSKHNTD